MSLEGSSRAKILWKVFEIHVQKNVLEMFENNILGDSFATEPF